MEEETMKSMPEIGIPEVTSVTSCFTIGVIVLGSNQQQTVIDPQILRIINGSGIKRQIGYCNNLEDAIATAKFLASNRHVHVIFTAGAEKELIEEFKEKNGHSFDYALPISQDPCSDILHRQEGHVAPDLMGTEVTRSRGEVLLPKHTNELYIPPEAENVLEQLREIFSQSPPRKTFEAYCLLANSKEETLVGAH